MAVALVGRSNIATATTGTLTASLTARSGTIPLTAGHLLVAVVNGVGSTTCGAITQSGGSDWVKAAGEAAQTLCHTAVFWKVALGADGAPAFTCTRTGTYASMQCVLYELSGTDLVAPVITYGTGTAASANVTPLVTLANVPNASCYALGGHAVYTGSNATDAWTKSTSWTADTTDAATARFHHAWDLYSAPPSGATLSFLGTWVTVGTGQSAMEVVIAPPYNASVTGAAAPVTAAGGAGTAAATSAANVAGVAAPVTAAGGAGTAAGGGGASIALRAAGTGAGSASSVTSVTLTLPTGTVAGDLCLYVLKVGNTGQTIAKTGGTGTWTIWSQASDSTNVYTWMFGAYVLQSGDTAPTFGWGTASNTAWSCTTLKPLAGATLSVDAWATELEQQTTVSSVTPNAATAAGAGEASVILILNRTSTTTASTSYTWTPPSGWTQDATGSFLAAGYRGAFSGTCYQIGVGSGSVAPGSMTLTDTAGDTFYWSVAHVLVQATGAGAADVTGVAAPVTAAGGAGTAAATSPNANVTGVAAPVTVASPAGVPAGAGAANVTGVAAPVTAAGGVGTATGYLLTTFDDGTLQGWATVLAGSGAVTVIAGAAHDGSYGLQSVVPSAAGDTGGAERTIQQTQVARVTGWWRVTVEGASGSSNVPFARFYYGSQRLADVYRQNTTGEVWLRVVKSAGGTNYTFIDTGQTLAVSTWVFAEFSWSLDGTPHVSLNGTEYIGAGSKQSDFYAAPYIDTCSLGSVETGNQGTWQIDTVMVSPPLTGSDVTGVAAPVTAASPAGVASGSAPLTGAAAPVTAAAPAGVPHSSTALTGVAAPVTVAAPAGVAFGGTSGTANVTGAAALVTVASPAGVASSAANITGTAAPVTAASPAGVAAAAENITGTAAHVTVAAPAGVPLGTAPASVTGVAAPVTAASPAGAPSSGSTITGVAAPVTAASPAGVASAGGAANVTGTAAAVTAASPAGVPHSGSAITGTAAPVTVAGGQGTAGAPVSVTGTAAHVTAASPAGTLAGAANITGTAAPVLTNASAGALSAAAQTAGLAALVTILGGAGTPHGGGATINATSTPTVTAGYTSTPTVSGAAHGAAVTAQGTSTPSVSKG